MLMAVVLLTLLGVSLDTVRVSENIIDTGIRVEPGETRFIMVREAVLNTGYYGNLVIQIRLNVSG